MMGVEISLLGRKYASAAAASGLTHALETSLALMLRCQPPALGREA